jgi:hypothetical protein
MNTKLTLSIEQTVIEKAKVYARNRKRSLSDLIENYLKALTSNELREGSQDAPIVHSLRGSFKAPDNFDYKEELGRRLSDKYLK